MIGETLKRLRGIYGYSARDMSSLLGISSSYLSEIERGKKKPSLKMINCYAEIFGMRPSSLLRFSEEFDRAEYHEKGQEFISKLMVKLIDSFSVEK